MSDKQALKREIWELDFMLHELVLYLDTHPSDAKALEYTAKYRAKRAKAVADYEKLFGPMNTTADRVPTDGSWKWIKGPWPWENAFTEE